MHVRDLFYRGSQLQIAGTTLQTLHAAELAGSMPVRLQAGAEPCELLLLAGKPIAEPVVQYGPFLMNTRTQIQEAVSDYQRTGFGGGPWPSDDPVQVQHHLVACYVQVMRTEEPFLRHDVAARALERASWR
jgi:hypothetical protein